MTVAELLGIPSASFARTLEVTETTLRIERQTEEGYDVVESPLPALATVTGSATEPRYPTLKGIMSAKTKPVEQIALADLGLSAEEVAPAQRVTAVSEAPEKGPGEIVQAGDEAATKLAELLAEAKVL
jgi:electron transfer flavoprotein beta subunit